MKELNEAIQEYRAAFGIWPWDEFARVLNPTDDRTTRQDWSAEDRWRADAEDLIIRGVLQVVASRLVDQKTQEAAGNSEMNMGLREMQEIRDANRKAHAKQMKDDRFGRAAVKPKLGRPRKA
jgi:hypothetical protein